MHFIALTSSLLLAGAVLAQQTPAGFTPAVDKPLDVYYGTTYISPGLLVKKSAVAKAPTIGLTNTTLTGKYLLAMIDVDASGTGPGLNGRTTVLHALLTDYTSSGTTQNGSSILTTKATGPSSYFGPAPPAETPKHPHNYIFLLHAQPDGFAVPASQKQVVSSRMGIDWNKFASEAKLEKPVAATYLQVQSGDITVRRFVEF
ncbi:PEBP-like protein [Lophiostoma macrostomum CBS 122681]|uniref:PEBP-like protein n=1 Tax=Lophiostoma macrostomum CBS 122681 TaxID=1314788 RepID=A0A6A6TH39_9PLEO|nr:PEBP-like protein [Lophiostoma macrostomum CBS 122681]